MGFPYEFIPGNLSEDSSYFHEFGMKIFTDYHCPVSTSTIVQSPGII